MFNGSNTMSENDIWTTVVDKDVLEWVIDNIKDIEAITPRILVKIMDIKKSEPERWKEMANIKFGV
jgi:ribosomal protein S25